ncbi:MAG: hypothetical protein N0C84_00695 [Candidatus Thiodiazotropha taylori]|nr:hypothetical protein [Candidatus Thiodiazotropha taylori]
MSNLVSKIFIDTEPNDVGFKEYALTVILILDIISVIGVVLT